MINSKNIFVRFRRISELNHYRCLSNLSTDPTWKYDYDVLIIGGGVVGASLACKLGSSPISKSFKIGLVEGRAPALLSEQMKREVPDARVYTIAPSSKKLLDDIDVWNKLSSRVHAFSHMHVFDSRGYGSMHFDAKTAKVKELGHVVEHNTLQSALFEQMLALSSEGNLDLLCPAEVTGIDFQSTISEPAGPMYVEVKNASNVPQKVSARLVIAADGNGSKIKRFRGLGSWGWSYGQRAVVCTVKIGSESDLITAWQRFLPNGPVALLPMWDNFASIVWSTTPEEAESLKQVTSTEFIDRLNAALHNDAQLPVSNFEGVPILGYFMGEAISTVNAITSLSTLKDGENARNTVPPLAISLEGARLGFDLSLSQCTTYVAPRLALVGDAAHVMHPMAGQGLNLGLSDVDGLVRVLFEGAYAGADIGCIHLLEKYNQDRRMRNLGMMGGMDALQRLFGSSATPLALARNVGMAMIDLAPPLKKSIARVAMGI